MVCDVWRVTCDLTHDQVFFLKVDGLNADDARWNDGANGAGTVNFTWLRAAITPPSSFESVGVYEAAAEDVSFLQSHAATASTASFFKKKPEKEDDAIVQGREARMRRIDDAKKLADSKMKMSESVHTWVLCPFRSAHTTQTTFKVSQ